MNRHTRNSRFASMVALSIMASCSVGAAGTATADNPAGTSAPRQPVKYEVLEKSNINNEMFEPGQVVHYAGLPSENLKPLCDEGRARAVEYAESNARRVRTMVEMHKDSETGVGDPSKFMAAFAKELATQNEAYQAQIAHLMEIQQQTATALAQASADLAAAAQQMAAVQAAAPAAPETPAAPAGDTTTAATDTGDAKDAPAKRTRG